MNKYMIFWGLILIFLTGQSPASSKSNSFYYAFKDETDETIWEKGQYSFPGSSNAFWPANIISGPDFVSLMILKKLNPTANEPYAGALLMTKRFFTYGKFTVRMRAAITPGVICSFFLMNQWQPGNWLHKEIDIEFLGKDRHTIQYNVHRFYSDTESAVGKPYISIVSFDYGAGFHEYSIIWTKNCIQWKIDGRKVYERKEQIPDEPLAIILNAWIPDQSWGKDWVGTLNPLDLPCRAEYAWIKYEPL